MEQKVTESIDHIKLSQVYKHLPQVKTGNTAGHNCSRCFYINDHANHFCTNCGYPMHEGEAQLLYQFRVKQRNEMLKKNILSVQLGRGMLYIIAALFLTVSIGFLFNRFDNHFVISALAITSAALFYLLARWSISKPFTALLTAFVIVLTFSTIAVFGEFTHIFISVQGIYTIIFCLVVSWFLLRSVQAAYKADLINEEIQVT